MMFFHFLKIIFDISTSKRSKKYKPHSILAKKKNNLKFGEKQVQPQNQTASKLNPLCFYFYFKKNYYLNNFWGVRVNSLTSLLSEKKTIKAPIQGHTFLTAHARTTRSLVLYQLTTFFPDCSSKFHSFLTSFIH